MATLSIQELNLICDRFMEDEVERAGTSNYYYQAELFQTHDLLPIPRKKIQVDRPTILIFADDAPLRNWSHACRYILVSLATGEVYREIPAQFPPYLALDLPPDTFVCFHRPKEIGPYYVHPVTPRLNVRPRTAGRRYAILFSGLSEYRHVNDMEFLYRTLRDVYHYQESDIMVFNHSDSVNIAYSGPPKPISQWPGNNTGYRLKVNAVGKKNVLMNHLIHLKTQLTKNDSLLIHINNHGGLENNISDICCYPNDSISDNLNAIEFTNQLDELRDYKNLMIMMEQCHSGGFVREVIRKSHADSTSIAVSCKKENTSHGAVFNPFAMNWIAAMAGHLPSGTDLRLGARVTAKQAYSHAKDHCHSEDSPDFAEKDNGGADVLGESLIRWPHRLPRLEPIIRRIWPEYDAMLDQILEDHFATLVILEAQLEKEESIVDKLILHELRMAIPSLP